MQNSSPKIWVVGCNGQLGHDIKTVLQGRNIDAYYTDLDVNVTSKRLVNTFTKDKEFQYIINCAAYTAVDKAETDVSKAYDLNCTAVENLCRVCRKHDATLIHISTDYVFDGSKRLWVESEATGPLNIYGRTKLFGELSTQALLHRFYIIRTSWLYGEHGNNFVHTMLKLFKTKNKISVVNDQHGSPTYSLDLATTIATILDTPSLLYGVYHYANQGTTTWFEFANEIYKIYSEYFDRKIQIDPISSSQYVLPAIRPTYSTLVTDKIQRELNIEIPAWQESLNKFLRPLLEKMVQK